ELVHVGYAVSSVERVLVEPFAVQNETWSGQGNAVEGHVRSGIVPTCTAIIPSLPCAIGREHRRQSRPRCLPSQQRISIVLHAPATIALVRRPATRGTAYARGDLAGGGVVGSISENKAHTACGTGPRLRPDEIFEFASDATFFVAIIS